MALVPFSQSIILSTSQDMQINTVQEALAAERANISFKPSDLSEFLYGKEFYKQMWQTLDKYDVPTVDFNHFNEGRRGAIKAGMRDFPVIYNNIVPKGHTGLTETDTIYLILASANSMPGGVHIGMFMKCIEILGTDRQHKQFLEKCRTYQIVGAYAQTEMAHGSDVASLMTTATLDMETDEFIIETPNIKAIKFWPGELGIFATHALVFAQLIIGKEKFGVHSFVVRIRDDNMKPLPGVECGDIGPKIGFFSKDNGYLILHKVRISRKDMLSRYISVTKDGKLRVKGDPKVSYATMMDIRKHLSSAWPKAYAQGITIATRYSMFRKQFKDSANQELRIIDYQLQQEKLISRAAEYYAITRAGNKIRDLTNRNIKQVKEREDFSLMAESHACLSLGKPYFGQIVYDGIEICRRACGGHGYSHYSGFPSLINEYSPNVTLEGQNTVLYLQVARYLLKNFKYLKTKKKQLGQSVKYIQSIDHLLVKRVEADQPLKWTMEDFRVILAQAVCYLLNETTAKLINKEEGYSDKDAWNYTAGIRLRQLAMTHSVYFTFESFKESVQEEKREKIRDITKDLCLLYGITAIMSVTVNSPILQGGFLNAQQIDSLHELKEILLKKLRPDLIGIVDGFGLPEKYYRSALIRGNPYQGYLKLARENSLNHGRLASVDVVKNITKQMRNPNASL